MNRFKNLDIWKRSVDLATDIYRETNSFPNSEKYGLASQLRKCVISISSNIAEGAGRSSYDQFKYFLSIAYGSLYELETQLIISRKLHYLDENICDEFLNELHELQKMIYAFSKSLSNKDSRLMTHDS